MGQDEIAELERDRAQRAIDTRYQEEIDGIQTPSALITGIVAFGTAAIGAAILALPSFGITSALWIIGLFVVVSFLGVYTSTTTTLRASRAGRRALVRKMESTASRPCAVWGSW